MKPSIFTKIIGGEIPCHKIYEDKQTFAFLDIHPVQAGHTLVIPKQQVQFVWELDTETYHAVMATVHKLARHIQTVLDAPYIGSQIVGVDVPHAHVHLIPFSTVAGFKQLQDMSVEPDHEALAKLAAKLAL